MSTSNRPIDVKGCILFFLLLWTTPSDVSSFAFSRIQTPSTTTANSILEESLTSCSTNQNHRIPRFDGLTSTLTSISTRRTISTSASTSKLSMVRGDDEGPGTGVSITAALLFLIFVAGSVIPLAGTFGMKGDMSIADSVVTRQDAPGKLQNFESKQYSLSRSAIQEKLNAIPVFYIATAGDDGTSTMSTDIYLSFEDAKAANAGLSSSSVVKGTTLDQVMYVALIFFVWIR